MVRKKSEGQKIIRSAQSGIALMNEWFSDRRNKAIRNGFVGVNRVSDIENFPCRLACPPKVDWFAHSIADRNFPIIIGLFAFFGNEKK